MSGSSSSRRNPLIISGNSLSSGDRTTTFAAGSPDSLLRSYLIFVRDMRGQRREPSIELRTEDVSVLAHHLGVTEELVLGGLLDLMGATRAQRTTMLAMLAAGALTVVLSGTIVSSLSTDGVSVEMERLADAVQAAVTSSGEHVAEASTTDAAASTEAEAGTVAAMSSAAPTRDAARTIDAIETVSTSATDDVATGTSAVETAASTPTADVLRSASAAASRATSEGVIQTAPVVGEPASIAIAPDGSLVASVAPPVPDPPDPIATAELPDGTVVAVVAPPVPPASPADDQVATAELPDGTTVGVAAPPVPPAPQD